MFSMEISSRTTMMLRTPPAVSVWLKAKRRERGMTQSELAQKAGVTQRLVSDFERARLIFGSTRFVGSLSRWICVCRVLTSVWRAKTRNRWNGKNADGNISPRRW